MSDIDTTNHVVCRLLIPTRLSGGLIGKGGSIIKQLRQDSGATLDIASNVPNTNNRVLTTKGSKENVVSGILMVANRLSELAAKQNESSQDVNIVFIVANSQVGCILGRAGAVIKTIREDSGANLKMSDQPLPASTDKTLTVKGDSSQVEIAVDRICEQLSGYTGRANARFTEIPYTPKPYPATGVPGMPPYIGGGAAGGRGGGPYGGYPPPPQPYGAPYGGGFPGAGQQAFGGGFPPSEIKFKSTMPIEEQHVGTVIGKGGSNIQDIRARSGAQVKMEQKSEDGKEGRQITITGTQHQFQIATALITQKIASFDPDYQGRGGGNRRGGGRPQRD